MKLYEVLDTGSIRSFLAVKQGEVNKQKSGMRFSTIPFVAMKDFLQPLGITTPDALRQAKDVIDPTGDVIDRVEDNGTVILKTKDTNPNQPEKMEVPTNTTSIDQMASSAAKKAISSKI